MPDNEEMDDKHDELTEGSEAEAEHEPESLLREIEKDEDDDDEILPPRKSNKMLIAALSIVIFLALFIFFKGEDVPNPDQGLDVQPPMTENMTPPSEDLFEEAEVAPEPNAGKILIADEEKDAESEKGQEKEKGIVPIPKEELAFFDPLSDTEEDRDPSQSEEMALVKAEKPKPVSVKPAVPKAKPKKKPKALKARKMAADVFTIQLGAFKGRSGADKLDDQLRNNGYDSFVLVMPNDVYRVRVGSFKSRKAAKQMAARIKKTEDLDSFVTTE
ncbi:MAG: SPOR domain-containing protein [Nitrospirota bacterium]|nr:SPOR domain-containing protein [Nitrospirota bacterium]